MRTPRFILIVAFIALIGAMVPAQALAADSVAGSGDTLSLSKPRIAPYRSAGRIAGTLTPARAGVSVSLVRNGAVIVRAETKTSGRFVFRFRLVSPGPYTARSGSVKSAPMTARIRPILTTSLSDERIVGQPVQLRTRLRPATSGKLRLIVVRGHNRPLSRFIRSGESTAFALFSADKHTIWVEVEPNAGYTQVARRIRVHISAPLLRLGSNGPAVRLLEDELVAHHFALLHADSTFGADTLEAVYALQKLTGLSRSGSMSIAAWRALGRSEPPQPRLHGSYIEIDKTKQVLYVVRNGTVTLIVPVSTGATGNTPIGVFHVYSRVPGGAVMYYSSYFTGAFAIHGYVSVPPYPASHGCVRIPMWLATHVYGLISLGMRVYIHY